VYINELYLIFIYNNRCVHQKHNAHYCAAFNSTYIFLTFDLEGRPWPWTSTTQNVQLHEIHMHAKYQVAIFNVAKLMANVNFFSDRRTDWHPDWLTDSSTAICHPSRGIQFPVTHKHQSKCGLKTKHRLLHKSKS